MEFFRAEDRARTGHPDLGKVVLYQMSYFRMNTKNFIPKSILLILFFYLGVQKYTSCHYHQISFQIFYLYLGVYKVLSGTSTSGLPL